MDTGSRCPTLFKAAACAFLLASAACRTLPAGAPFAARIPKELSTHGDVRVDDYHWLNQRGDKEVLRYLRAENRYTEKTLAHTEGLQKKLVAEMKSRIKQDDMSAPYELDGWYYYHREAQGREYRLYCRKKGSLEAPEEVILDVNALAKGHAFYDAGPPRVSPDHNLLAYAEDTTGRRLRTIRIKDLRTGKTFPDAIPNASGSLAWANDNKTFFYVIKDTTTLREYRVLRHVLGEAGADAQVYEETDDTFSVELERTSSKKFVMIESYSTLWTEYRLLEADDPMGDFRVFSPRTPGVEYFVTHGGDRFYIRTNQSARNFRLMETPEDRTGMEHWREVVAHDPDVLLDGVAAFSGHLALEERAGGLIRLRVLDRKDFRTHTLEFDEPAFSVHLAYNPRFETEWLRFGYESLTTPDSTYRYHMESRERRLLKRKEVPGGFKPEDYTAERIFAAAPDGERVPISLVYRRGMNKDGRNPVLLSGYGAYGISYDPSFDSDRLSLLDRGFIFAIAHIRGGSEMGRRWYEDGRQLKKMNTFTDFIAAARELVAKGYTSPRHLYAEGGSAGGLLMGAVLNLAPDLFNAALVDVAFVDVLTTMLDPGIPLTTSEYDEWGDPNKKIYYDYIKSYSPYDDIAPKAYPHILATTGLNDSQVQYWEPAKWVAKLRRTKTDRNRLLLRTDMEVGHGGASGRFEKLKTYALQYAFILDLEGIKEGTALIP